MPKIGHLLNRALTDEIHAGPVCHKSDNWNFELKQKYWNEVQFLQKKPQKWQSVTTG